MSAPEGMLTLAETERLALDLLAAMADDDVERVATLMTTGYEPGPANYRLLLSTLPTCAGVALRAIAGDEGDIFSMPQFGADATDAEFFAGRIVSAFINGDGGVGHDLITALIRKSDGLDDEAATHLLANVLVAVTQALWGSVRALVESKRGA